MRHRLASVFLAGILMASSIVSVSAANYPTAVEYPVEEGGFIQKTYRVETMEEIDALDRNDVAYQGVIYHFLDITVVPEEVHETKNFIETVVGEAESDDKAKILETLELKREVTTEDGFTGTLDLDTTSLTTDVTEYGWSSSRKTITQTYPGFSEADLALLPKTVTKGSVTYSLTNADWKEESPYNPYDPEYGTRFTATATYSANVGYRYAKGYNYGVKYYGMVEKSEIVGYDVTILFAPEIQEEEDHWYDVLVGEKSNPWVVAFAILLLLLLLGCAVFTAISLLRGRRQTVTTEEYIVSDRNNAKKSANQKKRPTQTTTGGGNPPKRPASSPSNNGKSPKKPETPQQQ